MNDDGNTQEPAGVETEDRGRYDIRIAGLTAGQDFGDFFRPTYRELSVEEADVCDRIKLQAGELLGTLVNQAGQLPGADPAQVTLAVRALEDCVMRGVKGITG